MSGLRPSELRSRTSRSTSGRSFSLSRSRLDRLLGNLALGRRCSSPGRNGAPSESRPQAPGRFEELATPSI
jgi:hypothetical protein